MARKALIEIANGRVVNVIEADDTWKPPQGHKVLEADGIAVSPGDTWDGVKFVPRPLTPKEIAAIEKAQTIAAAKKRFLDALPITENTPPWGAMLRDLAVVLELKEA